MKDLGGLLICFMVFVNLFIYFFFFLCRDGKPNGRGTYVFENGDIYTGNFENDEFHGEGSWSG